MLLAASEVQGLEIVGLDRSLGFARTLYVDDRVWLMRYLGVAATSRFAVGEALFPVLGAISFDPELNVIRAETTRHQLDAAPGVDGSLPILRELETQLYQHYGRTPHWSPPRQTPPWPASPEAGRLGLRDPDPLSFSLNYDPRLRSGLALHGYQLTADDGGAGFVDDLLIDPSSWSVEFLVIAIRGDTPSRKVVVPIEAVGGISDMDKRVYLELGQDELLSRPELHPSGRITEQQEATLRGYTPADDKAGTTQARQPILPVAPRASALPLRLVSGSSITLGTTPGAQ